MDRNKDDAQSSSVLMAELVKIVEKNAYIFCDPDILLDMLHCVDESEGGKLDETLEALKGVEFIYSIITYHDNENGWSSGYTFITYKDVLFTIKVDMGTAGNHVAKVQDEQESLLTMTRIINHNLPFLQILDEKIAQQRSKNEEGNSSDG